MQYKIPVQIENEDIIFLNLSLRQLIIIMGYFGVGYTIFKSVNKTLWPEVWLIVAAPIVVFGILIAYFKHTEMTFLPFFLNFIRLQLNSGRRIWSKWVESYPEIIIGFVKQYDEKEKQVNTKSNDDTFSGIEDKLSRI